MKDLNFEDVSVTLERLRKNIESCSYPAASIAFPKVQLNNSLSTLTNGLSLANSSYFGNITYEQDIFSELPMIVFDESYNSQMAGFMKDFRVKFYKRISEGHWYRVP